jgi:hypothetical protein
VKICSLYGVGYYYIPGTDFCIKIGGYVRTQLEAGATAGGVPNIYNGGITASQMSQNRLTQEYGFRMRGYLTADVRNQTEYGTLRSYMAISVQNQDNGTDAPHTETAFIQFAGFTIGIAPSFYDFHAFAPYGYLNPRISSNTGAGGNSVFGYTARFGGGLSASIAIEDNNARRTNLIDATTGGSLGTAAAPITAFNTPPVTDYEAPVVPDINGNIRVDQAWGSAQIMGAAHRVGHQYTGSNVTGLTTGLINADEKWGWAVGAGLKLNIPGTQGDVLDMQFNYAKGALSYVHQGGTLMHQQQGNSMGYGWFSDAVVIGGVPASAPGAAAGTLELTTGWSVEATYQHVWNAKWRTSVNAAYNAISYSDAANNAMCAIVGRTAAVTFSNCDNDFSGWFIGSRTVWYPSGVAGGFEIGLDVGYTKLNTASEGTISGTTAISSSTSNPRATVMEDQDVWSVAMRWQRNFWP